MTEIKTTLPSGRPSICEWSMTATFKMKRQATKAVEAIMAEDIDFPVSFRTESDVYLVEISGMVWAENLKTVARILTKVDHKMP